MSRDLRVYLGDIEQSCGVLEHASSNRDTDAILNDKDLCDSLARSLQTIADSAKHLPEGALEQMSDIDWEQVCSLDDVKPSADVSELMDDIIRNLIPALHSAVENCRL